MKHPYSQEVKDIIEKMPTAEKNKLKSINLQVLKLSATEHKYVEYV